jgi:hypothetical protein
MELRLPMLAWRFVKTMFYSIQIVEVENSVVLPKILIYNSIGFARDCAYWVVTIKVIFWLGSKQIRLLNNVTT